MSIPSLKLVSHKLCPYVQRAAIVLYEKQVPYEREYVDLLNKPDWFLAISPLGKVPLLLVGKEVLFESAVICEYLDEITLGSLHPDAPLLKAKHRAWIEFGSSILNAIAGFYSAKDEMTFAAKRHELVRKFQTLKEHLQERPFFSGDHFCLVDAVYGPIFRYFVVFEQYKDFGFFTDTHSVVRWRTALLDRPSVIKAVLPNYPQLLHEFLLKRDSHLTQIIQAATERHDR